MVHPRRCGSGHRRENYDLVVLDIELGRERHAGVAIINAINKGARGTPVLVVSAMPATIYRSIMKALDAWDYLQKTTFRGRLHRYLPGNPARRARSQPAAKPLWPATNSPLTPCGKVAPLWRGKRVNLPLTAQRILATLYEKRGQVVSYDELFQVVKSGRNRDNIRKHISTIREAFRELDEDFDCIENIPMRGFRWSGQTSGKAFESK
jgi:DNA-binding response OmpR family regulator